MLTLAYADGEAIAPTDRQVTTWSDERGVVYARAFARGASHRIAWRGVGVFAFARGSTQVRVTTAPGASDAVVEDTFSRLLQPLILQALGWQALHGSAVVGSSGVWAFCARSGSGKSTLAYALARAGFRQFADDAVVLGLDEGVVVAHPVPFIPRLEPPSRAFLDPEGVSGTRLVADAAGPLSAIFILSRHEEATAQTTLTRLEPAQAFTAILAHAHCFDTDDRMHTSKLVADYLVVAETVAVFACAYRPGFVHLPHLVGQIEEAGRTVASHQQVRQCAPFG